MTSADMIAKHLVFDKIDSSKTPNLISYTLRDHANGDAWKDIKVVFNGASESQSVNIPQGNWTVIARDGKLNPDGLGTSKGGRITLAPYSALILVRN